MTCNNSHLNYVHQSNPYSNCLASCILRLRVIKTGGSRGRAPGQASDYTLQAPNPLDSSAMTRFFI